MSADLPVRHRWRDALVFSADPRIDVYGLAVATALHVHMSPDGRCTVGLRRLAEIARCSVNTVRARLDALEAAGLLAIDRDGQARTIYRARLADEPALEPAETAAAGPVDNPPGPAGPVSPEPPRVSPHGPNCVTGRHTYPLNPLNPARRSSPFGGVYDPSVGRPPPDRRAAPPPRLSERDDGTLWVAGAGR